MSRSGLYKMILTIFSLYQEANALIHQFGQIKTERLFFVKKRRSVELIETYEPMAQASITGVILKDEKRKSKFA